MVRGEGTKASLLHPCHFVAKAVRASSSLLLWSLGLAHLHILPTRVTYAMLFGQSADPALLNAELVRHRGSSSVLMAAFLTAMVGEDGKSPLCPCHLTADRWGVSSPTSNPHQDWLCCAALGKIRVALLSTAASKRWDSFSTRNIPIFPNGNVIHPHQHQPLLLHSQ